MKKFNLILCKVFIILTIIVLFNSILLIITSIVSYLANLIKNNGNTDFIIYNNWIIDFLDSGLIGVILSTINFQVLKLVFGDENNKDDSKHCC